MDRPFCQYQPLTRATVTPAVKPIDGEEYHPPQAPRKTPWPFSAGLIGRGLLLWLAVMIGFVGGRVLPATPFGLLPIELPIADWLLQIAQWRFQVSEWYARVTAKPIYAIVNDKIDLHAGPGEDYEVYGTVYKGQIIRLMHDSLDGWIDVEAMGIRLGRMMQVDKEERVTGMMPMSQFTLLPICSP